MWFLLAIVALIVICFMMRNKTSKSDGDLVPIEKMDATKDAAAIWERLRELERPDCEWAKSYFDPISFKKIVYNKLTTSKDGYTCQLLGDNTFSYLSPNAKDYVILEMANASVEEIENESIPLLELAKMVAKQKKILDFYTIKLLDDFLQEKKIYPEEIFEPVWLNNPKIWEQSDNGDRVYLIKLKVFLDTASLHKWTDRNGQTLYDIVGEGDSLFIWEALINKYDSVNKIQKFLAGFSDG